jgi:hypothetical protein
VQWKYAQIITIAKPGKPPTETSSYRPSSLLPILSKLFEELILTRLGTIFINDIIPIHQFGFRANHSTIQQCHRIVNKIKESIEGKQVPLSSLTFHRLLTKYGIKDYCINSKRNYLISCILIKSYLRESYFQVIIEDELSDYHLIGAGVPQGSVLGPLLYLIFTADVPLTDNTLMATFADDTPIMSSHQDPTTASQKLQQHFNLLKTSMEQWKITVNPAKSRHITFTTRRADCPQVSIINFPIPIRQEVKYLGLHPDNKN